MPAGVACLSRAGSGAIELDLTQNSRIETQESLITVGGRTLTRGAGVHAFHRGTGNIEINHSGTINSGKGTGIYAQHDGTGDLSIVNSGTITSGFNGIDARRFDTGRLSITHSGSITSSSGPGIYARHDGARSDNDNNIQDVVINIKGDVTTTDPVQAAVRAETRGAAGNARIWIEHSAGTVTGYWGIFAGPMRFSGSTYEDGGGLLPSSFPSHNGYSDLFRTAVLIRVGGTARIVARNLPGSNNEFTEAQTMHQVGWVSRGLVGNYVGASGITVGGGDYQRIGQEIAAGDKLQTGVTPELRSQFRAIYSAAQAYGTQGRSLGNLLDPRILVGGFTGDPAVDADIDSYFNTGSNLERFREFTLTAQEKAVLEAAFGSGDLNMALNALPPSYTEDYKNTVRWYAGAYNNADFRVNVLRNGEINSDGDGIRLIRRFTSDNNGYSFVFIEEGAKVMAGRYGVRMSGAGISDSVHIPDDPNSPIPEGSIISLRNQVVEVYGELESTGPDGAAIALRGGGHVFVGADTILRSASGTTIKIDEADPGTNLIIQIKMKEGENIAGTFSRAVPGRIVNSSTTRAWVEDENGNFSLVPARTQPRPITPPILPTDSTDPTDPDPTDSTDPTDPDPEPGKESQPEPEPELQPTPPPNPAERMVQGPYDAWMDCDGTMCETHTIFAPRARVYEALPAVLLDMNSVSWRDGLMRDESGTWTGTIASSANRDLKNSTTNTSYDVDRIGVILGHDFETNDSETLGVFFQYQKGTAEIADGGKIDGHAMGAGVKYRRDFDPLTIGLRASIISFTNDLSSSLRGQLATGIIGTRYAVGMEAGNEIALSDAVLMLDAGLTYARVSANDFTSVLKDPNALSGTAEVKVTDISGEETALHARAEYRRTDLQWPVFAGAGLEIPLDSRAEVRVGNTLLSSERRIGASLHGGIALDDRIGGGDAALSLRYAKQGGGDTIQVNLTYGF